MGLDWRPMGKPKAGFEERFKQIFLILTDKEKQEIGFLDKLKGKKVKSKDELLAEWFEISDKTYETIKAPRVGRDKIADDWINEKYQETDKSISREEFIKEYEDYYVIELAEELDGVPVYIAMGQDENVFRGQFLKDCEDLIGEDLLNEGWGTKFADETLEYGKQLMTIADKVASENNILYLKEQRIPPDTDEESLESKIHILYAAAKWLIFYGKNGHGFEADF
jgi:alpha-L-fucosidase